MTRRWPLWTIDLAGAGGCLLLVGVAYLGGYAPWARARQAQAMQRAVLAEREEEIRDREKQIRVLTKQTEVARETLAGEAVLQSAAEQARRVSELSRLAAESGLVVAGLVPREPRPVTTYVVVPIGLSGTATPDALARFLATLHSAFRDTAVVSFDVGADPAQPEQPAQFSVDLLWHAVPAGGAGRAGAGARNPAGSP